MQIPDSWRWRAHRAPGYAGPRYPHPGASRSSLLAARPPQLQSPRGPRGGWKGCAPDAPRDPGDPSSYLHARLREPQALAELLAHEGVRVMRLVEQPLQLVQLLQREVGAAPPLLQLRLPVLVLRLHVFALLLAVVDTCVEERVGAEDTELRPPPPPPTRKHTPRKAARGGDAWVHTGARACAAKGPPPPRARTQVDKTDSRSWLRTRITAARAFRAYTRGQKRLLHFPVRESVDILTSPRMLTSPPFFFFFCKGSGVLNIISSSIFEVKDAWAEWGRPRPTLGSRPGRARLGPPSLRTPRANLFLSEQARPCLNGAPGLLRVPPGAQCLSFPGCHAFCFTHSHAVGRADAPPGLQKRHFLPSKNFGTLWICWGSRRGRPPPPA